MVSLRPVGARWNLCHLHLLSVQEHSYLDIDSKDICSCDGSEFLCGPGASTLISSDYNVDWSRAIQYAVFV